MIIDSAARARLVLERLQKLERRAFLKAVEGLSEIWLGFARALGAERQNLADRLLARAVEVWPGLPEVHEAVAERLAEDGDLEGADAFYQHALKLAPERPETWYELALVRSEARDGAGALEALFEVLERDPGHIDAVRRAIVIVDRLERPELRADFLQRLLALIEDDGEALAYIGFKLLAGRHLEGALTAFARAADLDLGSYEALIGATAAAHALGEAAAVKAYWEQALTSLPDDAEIWLEMAQTFGPDLPEALTRELIEGAAGQPSGNGETPCNVVDIATASAGREPAGFKPRSQCRSGGWLTWRRDA